MNQKKDKEGRIQAQKCHEQLVEKGVGLLEEENF